jgi:signal transduction histidine kinase
VGPGRVLGDPAHLDRLVRNLCDNAGRHARSSVALGVAAREDWVVFTVDDDGTGIPPADRDRAFDRFVRFDEARDRPSGGTGLGLAIVREIARAHGGDAELGDAPLGGLRASVRLPAAPRDQSAG